jgi:phospholipid-binding lipoprotein MlaA
LALFPIVAAIAGAAPLHAAPAAHASSSAPVAGDPWEGFNRRGYAINQFLDRILIRPISKLFRVVAPGPIGQGVHNFLSNLTEPVILINDLLQARPRRAGATTVRFVFNSTVGVLGLIDVAQRAGLPHHPNSFGDTLGRYGVGPGPYLFLPLLGPSTVRDLFGAGVDTTIDPLHWARYRYRAEISAGVGVASGLDLRSASDAELTALVADAADPYATLRSAFLQMRQGEIDEGRAPPPLPELEDPEAPAKTSPEPGQATPPAGQAGAPQLLPGPDLRGWPNAIPGLADLAHEPAAFGGLPDEQRRRPDDKIPGAFDQRQSD